MTRTINVNDQLPVGGGYEEDSDLERNPNDPMGLHHHSDIEEIKVDKSVVVNKSTLFKESFAPPSAN